MGFQRRPKGLFHCVGIMLAASMVLMAGVTPAQADVLPDVMLGVFTNSAKDGTDTFYMSQDGVHMEKISEAFKDLTPNNAAENKAQGSRQNGRKYDLYAFSCPSIIYHNGYFWMLSNEADSGKDHTLRLVVSNSKDLVHWSDQRQVKITVPANVQSNGMGNQFDAVAADWAVSPAGVPYAVVSLGYYGAFHGHPENDTMYPYLVRFTELYATNDPAKNPKANDPTVLHAKAKTAEPISLSLKDNNRIDGSLYFEGTSAYLSIKRHGVTNEIWKNNATLTGKWSLVNSNVLTGYEAPSLTKYNGRYYFYTDQLATWTPDDHVRRPYFSTGTHVQMSQRLQSGWTSPSLVNAYTSSGASKTVNAANNADGDGPRHGTVITVTDPVAKRVIWNLRKNAGWKTATPPQQSTFIDVHNQSEVLANNDWSATPHASDIAWLADAGVSQGWLEPDGSRTFRGMDSVKRQDMAAFLRREAKRLGVKDAASWKPSDEDWKQFRDVSRDTPHAEDVLWLAHANVSEGWREPDGSRTFRGMDPVRRQDMAAFLYRLAVKAGRGGGVRPGSFRDVSDATPHASEVRWLGGSGVSTGYADGTFRGMLPVYRQDMAAFLHRFDGLK